MVSHDQNTVQLQLNYSQVLLSTSLYTWKISQSIHLFLTNIPSQHHKILLQSKDLYTSVNQY